MKTKNKTLALLEIAIVLCSVFLVALPTITAASEIYEPGPLDIFGNANEDDTIDMRDTTYIKLVIFGKKPETDLADANYDGKVSMLDVGQTKLIILGKEKKLTLVDRTGKAITVPKPVERAVLMIHNSYFPESFRVINAVDKVVGVTERIPSEAHGFSKVFFPMLSKLPSCGDHKSPDYEAILNLYPDIVHTDIREWSNDEKEKVPSVTVIYMDMKLRGFTENMTKLGYIYDAREEAAEYINWRNGWLNKIKERIDGLSEDEKPQLLYCYVKPGKIAAYAKASPQYSMLATVGVKNLGAELGDFWTAVIDPEWIIVQNPDIIILHDSVVCGYEIDDTSEAASVREDFLKRPEFANVNAVKTKSVYVWDGQDLSYGGASGLIGIAYMAKLSHPDLFKDLDPEEIHQEYLTRFQHLDYDLNKHGVFVYPSPE